MKLRVAFFLCIVIASVILFSCRRNQPSLVDANRPPDTELWHAPPDSNEANYLVHMYWRGIDYDGTVERYIWTITDTLELGPLRWNPAIRVRDFRRGRITTRTDSLFAFTAFQVVGGVGIKKNRQAFHVASIDDNGVIDPSPAAIEFVATVERVPEVGFTISTTRICQGVKTVQTKPYNPASLDTVGMFRPFRISYHGKTTNGLLRGYKFFPLTSGVTLPGQDVWTVDLSDTLRWFCNGDTVGCPPEAFAEAIPSGEFRLAAQVRDDAGAESVVDAGRFTEGVCRLVVNFEPNTKFIHILNGYKNGAGNVVVDSVDFRDSKPDTVPHNSWLTLFYNGKDNPCDSSLCQDVLNECIRYQMNWSTRAEQNASPRGPGTINQSTIQWLPINAEDTNPFGRTDSTTINIGPFEYTLRARAVDEYKKPDGTPARVRITGSFKPTLDSFGIQNYDGSTVADNDTVLWDWWTPANSDTIDIVNVERKKVFYFVIQATGHDDPRDPPGSGIKAWYSWFRRPGNDNVKFARSGSWADGMTVNALSDTFRVTFRYPLLDFTGDTVFDNLPSYLDKTYEFRVQGRDTRSTEEFDQFMFYNQDFQLINNLNISTIGRLTDVGQQNFHFTMRR